MIGRVEICINNVWGRVCVDFWYTPDAEVTCRQLGIQYTSKLVVNSHCQRCYFDSFCLPNACFFRDCVQHTNGRVETGVGRHCLPPSQMLIVRIFNCGFILFPIWYMTLSHPIFMKVIELNVVFGFLSG